MEEKIILNGENATKGDLKDQNGPKKGNGRVWLRKGK